MHIFFKSVLVAAILLMPLASTAGVIELAQGSKEKCLHTCIEQYGADKKKACALQCGFGGGNAAGGQTKDCGTIYKQCLQNCGSNQSCKNNCRKQRTTCF